MPQFRITSQMIENQGRIEFQILGEDHLNIIIPPQNPKEDADLLAKNIVAYRTEEDETLETLLAVITLMVLQHPNNMIFSDLCQIGLDHGDLVIDTMYYELGRGELNLFVDDNLSTHPVPRPVDRLVYGLYELLHDEDGTYEELRSLYCDRCAHHIHEKTVLCMTNRNLQADDFQFVEVEIPTTQFIVKDHTDDAIDVNVVFDDLAGDLIIHIHGAQAAYAESPQYSHRNALFGLLYKLQQHDSEFLARFVPTGVSLSQFTDVISFSNWAWKNDLFPSTFLANAEELPEVPMYGVILFSMLRERFLSLAEAPLHIDPLLKELCEIDKKEIYQNPLEYFSENHLHIDFEKALATRYLKD